MIRGKKTAQEIEEYVAPKLPSMSTQMPSVGRKVHYMRYWNRVLKPMSADVVDVSESNPQMVNLVYWDPNGAQFFAANVLPADVHASQDEPIESILANRWIWPPRV